MKPIVVGLTGSMQAGKQESRPIFETAGIYFLDLNDLADAARLEHRDDYLSLGVPADAIAQTGRKTRAFYKAVLSIGGRELFERMMKLEVSLVAEAIKHRLKDINSSVVVVNWGYLWWFFDQIEIDHVLVFQCDRSVWLERLRCRAEQIGWANATDDDVIELARRIDMLPEPITEAVVARFAPNQVTTIDTSPEDWGAENLRRVLTALVM